MPRRWGNSGYLCTDNDLDWRSFQAKPEAQSSRSTSQKCHIVVDFFTKKANSGNTLKANKCEKLKNF